MKPIVTIATWLAALLLSTSAGAEVLAVRADAAPSRPDDAAWKGAPAAAVPLVLQDMVEPRLLQPSTAEVEVRAIADGLRIAFHLEWKDATRAELPGIARHSDA